MKLIAPIKHINGSNYPVETLLEKLALQPGGHYLLGSHEFWHGGVHITNDTITAFDKHPVCAIADGEIIAFRINENYPVLDLSPADTEQKSDQYQFRYSSSFCLVRHHYASKAAALKMQAKKDNPQQISQWVGRVVSFTVNRNVRNPGSKENEDNCTFRFQLAKGSRLKITGIDKNDNNFVSARVLLVEEYLDEKNNITTSQKELNFGDEVTFKINNEDGTFIVEDASDSCTDWREVKSIKTRTGLKGYPDKMPLSTSEFIDIPAGTELTVVQMDTAIVHEKQAYAKVNCHQNLNIKSQGDTPTTTGQHPAGTPFYVSLIDDSGNFKQEKQQPVAINNTRNHLTFYSLYMHLLPLAEYNPNQGKTFARPKGILSLRDANKEEISNRKINSEQLLQLNGEPVSEDDNIFQQVYLVDKFGKQQEKQTYWVNSAIKTVDKKTKKQTIKSYLNDAKPQRPADTKKIPNYLKQDSTINATARRNITVYAQNDKKLWYEVDQLISGETFSYSYHPKSNIAENQIARMKITLINAKGDKKKLAANNKTYYVKHEDITEKTVEEQITPKDFDNVVGCAIPVKAGELLGYPGLYESPTDALPDSQKNSKHQLHFEIFTADKTNLPDFLTNREKINSDKTYYKLKKGTTLIINSQPVTPAEAIAGLDLPAGYFKNSTTPTLIRHWMLPAQQVELSKIKPEAPSQAQSDVRQRIILHEIALNFT